jgi:hypothetical protein
MLHVPLGNFLQSASKFTYLRYTTGGTIVTAIAINAHAAFERFEYRVRAPLPDCFVR